MVSQAFTWSSKSVSLKLLCLRRVEVSPTFPFAPDGGWFEAAAKTVGGSGLVDFAFCPSTLCGAIDSAAIMEVCLCGRRGTEEDERGGTPGGLSSTGEKLQTSQFREAMAF